MIKKAEHIGIMVKNVDQSIQFYHEILGLPLIERRSFRDLELAFLKLGDTEIELIQGATDYDETDGIVNHLAFSVDDIDEALQRLREHGVTLIDETPRTIWTGCRIAFFQGPDGEKLELFERPAGTR